MTVVKETECDKKLLATAMALNSDAQLDAEKNTHATGGMDISAEGSPVRIYVVDTNEEIIVARKAQALLNS